jgi:hypothetical protein
MLRSDSGAANVREVTVRVPVPGEFGLINLSKSLTYLFFGRLQAQT